MLSFNTIKKNLKKDHSGMKTIRVALLADSASQLLAQAICGYGYEAGIHFDMFEADYQQIDAQIFNKESELYHSKPAFIIIHLSSEHLLKNFYHSDIPGRKQFAEDQIGLLAKWHQTIAASTNAKLLVNTFVELDDGIFGNYAAREKSSFLFQLRKLNLLLMEYAQQQAGLFIYDLLSLQGKLGYQTVFDAKIYFQADMVFNIDFLVPVAKSITDIMLAVTGIFRKAIIVDLDNTMWGGIIGDDGMEGIEIGSLGLGKAFTEFQQWLRELKRRGILIAVCSKNTEDIAKEPFIKHPDMVLRLDDIAVFVANWETKVENIRYIQSVLNIGFDSMVFIDDNPFEREMVRSAIREISIPALPEDPTEYLPFLRALNLFETASYTEEDEVRTQQYQVEQKRDSFQQRFTNESEFLESLDMAAELGPFTKFSIPRISQLSQRSNQFNLRTIRYTEDELVLISRSPEYLTFSFSLADKFGNYGLISTIILKVISKEEIFVDTWIMSCRVLKRGMENLALNAIVSAAAEKGYQRIIGEYIPTKKNEIVKNHFRDLGFDLKGDQWILETGSYQNRPTSIKVLQFTDQTFNNK
jgi:FkbH-like protein